MYNTSHLPTYELARTTPAPIVQPLSVRITIYAYCYILPVICVLGILGNTMNIITLASRRLRAVSYMYLRALAIADLLCMIFVLVFASFELLHYLGYAFHKNPWFGFYQAHLMLSFINWALATGVLVVVALSLERYVSIVFPMHFRAWNSPRRAIKAIIIAYSVPALFYIPYAIARYSVGTKKLSDGSTIYTAIDSELSKTFGWQIYKWTREGLLRFVPIVILSVLNLQIMLAFRKRQKMFARLTNRPDQSSSKDETLLYILGGIVVMFFICNIPAAINLLFINETVKKRVDYQVFRAMANLLEITNHAAQFYIFCACSTDYRVTFLQKFPCFKTYYVTADRFKSFIKREKQDSTEKTQTLFNNGNYVVNNSKFGSSQKRSTTITCEANVSTGREVTLKEQETTDVHLATGEEDLSEESDSLLKYGIITEENGTTYL